MDVVSGLNILTHQQLAALQPDTRTGQPASASVTQPLLKKKQTSIFQGNAQQHFNFFVCLGGDFWVLIVCFGFCLLFCNYNRNFHKIVTPWRFLPLSLAPSLFRNHYTRDKEEFRSLIQNLPFRSLVLQIGGGNGSWGTNPTYCGPSHFCKAPTETRTWICFHRLQWIQKFHFQLKYKEQTTDTCPDCSTFSADLLTVHKYCTIAVIFNHKKRKLYAQENNSRQLWDFHLSSMHFRKRGLLAKGQSPTIMVFSPSPQHVG